MDRLGTTLVDAVYAVHCAIGPGLLESAYQACLAHELRRRGLSVECEVPLPIHYAGLRIDAGYRVDMLLEGVIIVENKAVQSLAPIHTAQLLSYLRLSGRSLGFLINWNVPRVKEGIRRIVNQF